MLFPAAVSTEVGSCDVSGPKAETGRDRGRGQAAVEWQICKARPPPHRQLAVLGRERGAELVVARQAQVEVPMVKVVKHDRLVSLTARVAAPPAFELCVHHRRVRRHHQPDRHTMPGVLFRAHSVLRVRVDMPPAARGPRAQLPPGEGRAERPPLASARPDREARQRGGEPAGFLGVGLQLRLCAHEGAAGPSQEHSHAAAGQMRRLTVLKSGKSTPVLFSAALPWPSNRTCLRCRLVSLSRSSVHRRAGSSSGGAAVFPKSGIDVLNAGLTSPPPNSMSWSKVACRARRFCWRRNTISYHTIIQL